MVQERPLRIDFVIAVGETYIVIEGKSEGDYITSEDLYRLLLYSVGLAKKESVPPTEINERIITIIITPSTRNIRIPISKIHSGVYLVDIPTTTYLLVVDELELEPQILWLKVLSREGRLELYRHALRKRYLKIIGVLVLIDSTIRSIAMTEEKMISKALHELGQAMGYEKLLRIFAESEEDFLRMIRKLGEALGYDKLLQIFVENGEEISKALNKLANEIGYEKVIEIVLNMLKDLPPGAKKKIAEKLKTT